jgi:glycosyltransferase involved in cell wall biosynthesis
VVRTNKVAISPILSVVIPAYNEEARLGQTLRIVFAYLNEHVPKSEVIVVDDGSTDRTPQLAEESFAATGNIEASLIRVNPIVAKVMRCIAACSPRVGQ